MGEELRARKRGFLGGPWNRARGSQMRDDMGMYNRRALNTYDLKPPEYRIMAQYLTEEFVEKIVRYTGQINDVAPDIDITNRTDVLRVIDKGKKDGFIPPKVGIEHDAIFSLSVNNVKISRYNQTEDLLLRIPMHEIAAVCYIKDDGQHILALKHGTPDACSFSVLYCETKSAAEELCALIGQCFQLMYTDDTMQRFDSALSSVSISPESGSTRDSATGDKKPQFISSSTRNIPGNPGSISNSDISTHPELIKDYQSNLESKLNREELAQFAELLRKLYKSQLKLGDFCKQVYLLYGAERKYLLGGLSPFIPSADYTQFKNFLLENDIPVPENGTMSSSRSTSRIYARSVSEMSMTSTISNTGSESDDVELLLNLVAKLDASFQVHTTPDNYMK